mgnify:CR=1 FL=1
MSEELREGLEQVLRQKITPGYTIPFGDVTDAVLAYLTGRGVLIPELPQWVFVVTHIMRDIEFNVEIVGSGPNFAAAIADALKQEEHHG